MLWSITPAERREGQREIEGRAIAQRALGPQAAAVGLGQLERRLERVLVVGVDDRGDGGPVEPPVVGAEALARR